MAAIMLASAVLALLMFVVVARPDRMLAFERDAVVEVSAASAAR